MPSISTTIFLVYFLAWLYLVVSHVSQMPLDTVVRVTWNAVVMSFFVGVALNMNAFRIRSKSNNYRSLRAHLKYLVDNFLNIFGFFAIPFCVSSASGLVAAGKGGNMVAALIGTPNYLLIMVAGFVVLIVLPTLVIYIKHGWDGRPGED